MSAEALQIKWCFRGTDPDAIAGLRPVFEIRDRGPGYRYEPRLPDPATHVGGRGLFLISKLAHSVTVSSAPGGGSLTSVELAITRAREGDGQARGRIRQQDGT